MNKLISRIFFCSVFYISWIAFYSRLLFTNEFGFYVHPGLKPFSWALFGFILVFALESTYTVLKEKNFHFPAKRILLFVPLILMLGFSSQELSPNTISSMTGNFVETNVSKEEESVKQPEVNSKKSSIDDQPTIMAIENNDFYENFCKAYGAKQHYYIGRNFKIKGMFYTNGEQFHSNQGVVGRIVITCCVPHGQFFGFCVQFDNPNEIKGETWIEASGKLEMLAIKGRTVPVIRVKRWKKVKPGKIYFYLNSN